MSRNTSTRTLGLDLGDVDVHFALIDASGELIQEGRVPTSSPDLRALVHRTRATRAVLEASTHSPWIGRDLSAEGIEVLVLDPNRLQAVSQSVRKTDRNDARLLAQLGHAGLLLWQVHHRSEDAQRCLQLLMARDKVVRARTSLINQVRGQVKSLGHRLPGLHPPRFHTLREAAVRINPDLDLLFGLIETINIAVEQFDLRLGELADENPVAKRLMSIPGVGPITALAFVYVIDDPTRFESSRQVGPYLGLIPDRAIQGRGPRLIQSLGRPDGCEF